MRLRAVGAVGLAILLSAAVLPDRPLPEAAQRGDLERVRTLLEQGVDVNEAQGDGMTALHWAAERGDTEIARVLLRARANVGATTRIGGYTPLHLAAKSGSAQIVRALLGAGSDANAATTNTGATPLHFAAASGSVDAVVALIDRGARVDARDATEWAQTPLIFAAAKNGAGVIKVLIERGASPDVTETVVDVPARERVNEAANDRMRAALRETQGLTSEQVQQAIRAAREVQRTLQDTDYKGRTQDSGTYGAQVVDYIGGPPTLVGSWGGLSALHHAARDGHIDATLALIDGGANIDLRSGDGSTPLLLATINGQFDLALRLIERGANPNLTSNIGTAPLYAAVLVQWAPKQGVPPRAQDWQGATYLDVMKALLEKGADPNARLKSHTWYMHWYRSMIDLEGSTAFWRAAYGADVDALRLLAAHGADPNIPTAVSAVFRGTSDGELRLANPGPVERAIRMTNSRDFSSWQDPTGLPPVPVGGPSSYAIHAASGLSFGASFSTEPAHRHAPDGWVPAVKFLVEEMGADVNARDQDGYTPLHHAASRGDTALILYLVSKGADITAVARTGETVADMANGPHPRAVVFPAAVELLEKLGSKNNKWCMAGQSPATCIRT